MEMNPDDLMTPNEAALYLKVHPNTIYNWIRNGLLKVYRTPIGKPRIVKADLLKREIK